MIVAACALLPSGGAKGAEPSIPCELLGTCQQDQLLGLGERGGLTEVERFLSAGQLAALCQGDSLQQAACRLYIAGVHDTAELAYWQNQIAPPWCPVEGIAASRLQRLFLDYLRQSPEETSLPAAYAVSRALTYGLECGGRG